MGYNVYQGQIVGPFSSNEEIGALIRKQCIYTSEDTAKLWHLGIQAEVNSEFNIAEKKTKIGKTGIYEIGNLDIELKSLILKPLQDLPAGTIIDYVVIAK